MTDINTKDPKTGGVVNHKIGGGVFEADDPLITRIDEMIASLVYDKSLTEQQIFTICINFSWYFFGRHLDSLATSRDPGITKNYEALFYQFIYDYFQTIQGQIKILEIMLGNNLKTFEQYIEFDKVRQSSQQNKEGEDTKA